MNALATPVLTFDEAAHRYTLDGHELPSVTTILRTVGLINFDGIPERVLQGAQARGTRVHTGVHFLSEGTLDWSSVADEDRGYIEAAAAFFGESQFEVLAQEQRLFSRVYRIAGTCDIYGYWGGQPAVGDFKTGSEKAVAARYQLAWYALMLRERPPVEWLDFTPTTPIVRVSIEIRKDGTYTTHVHSDPRDTQVALAALTVYRAIEDKGGLRA